MGSRVSLEVIGAGFGRSGTLSLRKALETLGYAPCYHMQVTLTHYSHMKFWIRARRGEQVDYRRFFRRYRAHVEEVRAQVPPKRLLVYDVAEGWEPLCRFLGRPVPEGVDFPRLNDRRSFRRVINGLRIAEWAVPTALLAAMAWIAWRLWL